MYHFHVAICDDSQIDLNIISSYIAQIKEYDVDIITFMSGEKLAEYYENPDNKFDIIFLDMEMSGIDGIDTANKIREKDRNVVIIFVTNHKKYMEQSFECSPFRFLVKPLDFNKFQDVFIKACNAINLEHPYIALKIGRELIRFLYDDIIYFENKSHWVYIYTVDETYKKYSTFSSILKQLDMKYFVMTHKSFIINLNYFKRLDGLEVTLRNNTVIPISRNYKDQVKQKIFAFNERKYVI